MTTRRAALGLLVSSPALLRATRARAQSYPERAIRLVVPWAAGGSTDILARIVGEQLRISLGQPIVVENRPGAGGNIGSDVVVKAAPDGYTILFGSMSTHTMNPALSPSMPFDGVEDFTPIALLAFVLNTFVVNPSVPATNVREFVDYARANPGKLAYASGGAGSTNHLCAALLEKTAEIKMVHVPYRGGAPGVLDTVAGQTQLMFTAGTQTLEHVKAGALRLLGVTEGKRSEMLPDVPTVAETLPGYEMAVWYGAFAPKGLPPETLARLNGAINTALLQPAVKRKMAEIGVDVATGPPGRLDGILRADAARWGGLIRELGIRTS